MAEPVRRITSDDPRPEGPDEEPEPEIIASDDTADGTTADVTTKQIRGSSLLFVGKLLTMVIHFGSQLLIVRYLSKSDFGAFAYALSFVTLGQAVATLGLDRAITRFVPIYEERGERGKALGTLVFVSSTVLSLGLAMLVLAIGLRGAILGSLVTSPLAVSLLVILIVLSPIQALDSILMGMFAVYSRPRAIFFRKYLLEPGLRLIVVLLLIGTGAGVRGLAFGYVAAGAIGVLIYTWILIGLLRETGLLARDARSSRRYPVREILGFTIPVLTSDLVYLVMNTSDAILLGRYGTVSDVGALRVIQPAARLNQVVFTSFALLFTPVAARLFARDDRAGLDHLYWTTAVWIAVLTFPVLILTGPLASPTTTFLYGARYSNSGTYLTLLGFAYYANAALGFNGLTLKVVGRLRYIVGINVLAAVANLAINLILIPPFGPLGAAIGTTSTLLVFNTMKQLGLRTTGVRLLPAELARLYLAILAIPGALLVLQLTMDPPLLVGLVLGGLGSLAVLRIARPALRADETFPWLTRLPVIRSLIGGGG
jgi:O-antigen/teichoic acid export membrane protein